MIGAGRILLILATAGVLAACDVPAPDPETVARECEQQARAAQGPTGIATIGANSNSGPYSSLSVGISSDYLLGRDPTEVYAACYRRRTGEAPFRAPDLR